MLPEEGVPLRVMSERLGSSNPAFTMAIYQHILAGMQAEVADKFATLLQNTACDGFVKLRYLMFDTGLT